MSTLTTEETARIAEFVNSHELVDGLGDENSPCSIAAINLALTGKLTDDIPGCMSSVLGKWIITIQDRMPNTVRNSPEWKAALPLAAGTGRERENERLAVILSHMWRSLALLQPLADEKAFGRAWESMLDEKTSAAAYAADAAAAARAAAYAACAAAYASDAAAYASDAAYAADAAAAAAYAAAYAADAAYAYAAAAATTATTWREINPAMILREIIEA